MDTEKKYTLKDYMSAYLKMKSTLDAERTVYTKREKALKDKMAQVLDLANTAMVAAGDLDNVKHDGIGKAFYKTTEILNITDWDAALAHIKANELFHVLTKKLSKAAVQEIVKETGEIFPGAELGAIRKLYINKA